MLSGMVGKTNPKQEQTVPEEKHFDEWIKKKEFLHNKGQFRATREGEIWWAGIGENIGTEINGKSAYFSRPVLILRKLSRYNFMGVPLTSQPHEGSWYIGFEFRGRYENAVLAQARTLSVYRLYRKIGQLPKSDLESIRQAFLKLYS